MISIDSIYQRNQDNIIGHTILLLSDIGGSSILQGIANTLFPIYTAYHFAVNQKITKIYMVVAAVYLLYSVLVIYSNHRQNRIRRKAKELMKASNELQDLMFHRMKSLDHRCQVFEDNPEAGMDTESLTEANHLCERLYKLLSEIYHYDELEVVLWRQNLDEDGGTIAIPFSFATKGKEPPKWMSNSYNSKSGYRIFEAFVDNETLCYMTKKECQRELKDETEDSKTCQYIALPIRKRDNVTSCVLQLRSFKERVFPVNKERVYDMIRDFIFPFTMFYELVMDEDNVLDRVIYEDADEN